MKSCRLRNFATCEFSQVVKLPHAPLFTFHYTVHFPAPFYLFDFFGHFLVVSPNCPHCNSICFVILVICKGGLAIKAPDKHCNKSFSINKVFFRREPFSSSRFFSFPPLSLILSQFLGFQTPLEDDNSRDGWLKPLHP